MFRIRVAAAESKLKLLRDQARQARRRRKEAKRLAQQARKHFKWFKAELSDLRQALAQAEEKLYQAGGRARARKTAKTAAVAKSGARPSKKSKTVARKPRPVPPVPSRVKPRAARKKPAILQTKVVSVGPAALEPTSATPQIPETDENH